MDQGQRSCGSRSKVNHEGQRSRSSGQKRDFRFHLIVLEVKGNMGQGQKSHGLSPA